MKKSLLVIAAAVILLAVAFYSLNVYIYAEKQGNGDIQAYRGTLAGEVVCLPKIDTGGPTTLECALGLKTDAGEHYALDLAVMSQEQPGLNTGERISASGLITPIEMLSSDHWKKYDVEGIFSVTDSLRKL